MFFYLYYFQCQFNNWSKYVTCSHLLDIIFIYFVLNWDKNTIQNCIDKRAKIFDLGYAIVCSSALCFRRQWLRRSCVWLIDVSLMRSLKFAGCFLRHFSDYQLIDNCFVSIRYLRVYGSRKLPTIYLILSLPLW